MEDNTKQISASYADNPDFIPQIVNLPIELLEINEGQLSVIDEETNKQIGLPRNPRWIRDERFETLKKSITDDPEYLLYNPLKIYTLSSIKGKDGKYIVIGGNMRLRACRELGFKEVPCVVFRTDTPMSKLRAYTIKDNLEFGQNDWDILADEYDQTELEAFGMELDYIAPSGNEVNVDDFFKEQEEGRNDKEDKITVTITIPSELADKEEDIREAIKVTLEEWDGCKVS